MEITIRDDFDLEKIAQSGQCFRIRQLPGGMYRFISGRHILYIRPAGKIQFQVSEWNDFWEEYFDMHRSYEAVRRSSIGCGDYMERAAAAGAGIRILRQDPWETLVSFIISQRKTIPSIMHCIDSICRLCGESITTAYETVFTFPSAETLDRQADLLAQCSLGYRLPYVKAAARQVASGQTDLQALRDAGDDELMQALLSFYGVGRKVAGCVGLFAYGRTAMAPVDTWIRKVIDTHFGGKNPFPQWGENAGIMQQYLFYYARYEEGRIRR